MGKSFFEMMEGVLDEYADAKKRAINGVDMNHFYAQLKQELSKNVMQWFIKHVENISGYHNEIISEMNKEKPPTIPPIKMPPPTNKIGLNQ